MIASIKMSGVHYDFNELIRYVIDVPTFDPDAVGNMVRISTPDDLTDQSQQNLSFIDQS